MGVTPDAFTLRELMWMAYGRQRAEWDRAAAVIVHFRQAMGDKSTTFEAVHPHYGQLRRAEGRQKFKALSRTAQEQQRENGK